MNLTLQDFAVFHSSIILDLHYQTVPNPKSTKTQWNSKSTIIIPTPNNLNPHHQAVWTFIPSPKLGKTNNPCRITNSHPANISHKGKDLFKTSPVRNANRLPKPKRKGLTIATMVTRNDRWCRRLCRRRQRKRDIGQATQMECSELIDRNNGHPQLPHLLLGTPVLETDLHSNSTPRCRDKLDFRIEDPPANGCFNFITEGRDPLIRKWEISIASNRPTNFDNWIPLKPLFAQESKSLTQRVNLGQVRLNACYFAWPTLALACSLCFRLRLGINFRYGKAYLRESQEGVYLIGRVCF